MKKILISVSRQTRVASIRNRVLKESGYAVVPASSSGEVLRMLERGKFAAVLIGHSISQKEKRELIGRIKGRSTVPVISIYDSWPDYQNRANAYIHNLDGPEGLLQIIAEVAGQQSLRP